MGTLIDRSASDDNQYKFLFLIGRQKYPSANIYDYYATEKGSEGNGSLKFDLPQLTKELYTGDKLVITQLGKEYEVDIDKSLSMEYNPFIY